MGKDTTDLNIFVSTATEETIASWDRGRIENALVRETGLDQIIAKKISEDVEKKIKLASIKNITTSLIRELVNSELISHGLEEKRTLHTRLGVPLYDVDRMLTQANKENANVPHGPEATNLTLAEHIKKEYALLKVFSGDVADSHMSGDIHLHDLGFVDRPYCAGQSLEYVKKFGLHLPKSLSNAKPAKHAEVLLAHMVKFSAALQGCFAGAIGWDAVNLFFAPYLVGMSDRDVKQLAQMLIFEFSQQAVARGGQAIFSDINLYWEVPKHFKKVPAIGPGGEFTGKNYEYYEKDAQRFVTALYEVYLEGDGSNRPFFFPKPLLHITEEFFKTEGYKDFLNLVGEVVSEKGTPYFVFDRGETAKISQCCRLSFKLEQSDIDDARFPWKMRYSALQNVSVNLPRVAYEANGKDEKLFYLLKKRIDLCAKAHIEKRDFIQRLLDLGESGPLALLHMDQDGDSYLRMKKASFLMGLVGLNEMVQYHTGEQIHESEKALKFGLKVISFMNLYSIELGEKYKIKFILEQTPAESTAYRFAKLDLDKFEKAKEIVKGCKESNEIYYTNSTLFNVSAEVSPKDRIKGEGKFHPLIPAGSITHIWLGESKPDPKAIASYIKKIFKYTTNDQVAFSPEFTTCLNCGKTGRGLKDNCEYCGSENVDGITRITGYFTKISSWNKGKIGELRDRYKNQGFFDKSK